MDRIALGALSEDAAGRASGQDKAVIASFSGGAKVLTNRALQ
jgi:hypothetical protein